MDLGKLNQQLNEAKESMRPRIAILWGREGLLTEAVESILAAGRNWQVIKVLNPDAQVLAREVEITKPEIIIIDRGRCAAGFQAPLHLMENFPGLKIITINPDNNLVEIYSKQKFSIEDVSDLLAVIDQHSNSTVEGGGK